MTSPAAPPTTVDLPVPSRVLAIGAHPDDVEFGCGATLAKWADGGAAVHLLVLTDGSKGSWDPDADTTELVAVRREEQWGAARQLGVADVHFFDAVDGELRHDDVMVEQVCRVLRAVGPDVVLGHDPWKRYRLHPDHLQAGRLVIDGIVAARDPHFFPGAGAPHRPSHLLLFEAEVIDHVEDAHGFVDRKVAALLEHRSQWRSTMGIDASSPDAGDQERDFARRITDEARSAGDLVGREQGEAFKLLSDL